MRLIYSFIISLFSLCVINAQVDTSFVLVVDITDATSLTDTTFEVELVAPADQLGYFTPLGVSVDMRLIDGNGRLYSIYNVVSASFSDAVLRVVCRESPCIAPAQVGAIYRQRDDGRIPVPADGSTGVSEALQTRIHLNNLEKEYGIALAEIQALIGDSLAGVIDGSGNNGYVPKFSDSNTLTNSLIQDDGTRVGVGVAPASPAFLKVNGSIQLSGSSNRYLYMTDNTNVYWGYESGAWIHNGGTSSTFDIRQNNVVKLQMGTTGLFGIGAASFTPASRLELQTNNLGITQTATSGLLLSNTTLASSGAQQVSPFVEFSTQAWKSNATAASQNVRFRMDVLGVQGLAVASGSWRLGVSVAGSSYLDAILVTSGGSAATTGIDIGNFNGSSGSVRIGGTSGTVSFMAGYNNTFAANRLTFYGSTGDQSSIQGFGSGSNGGIAIGYAQTATNPGGANTTLNIKGADALSTSKALIIENSALTDLFAVFNNGNIDYGISGSGRYRLTGSAHTIDRGTFAVLYDGVNASFLAGSYTAAPASGTIRALLSSPSFAPTTGTAVLSLVEIIPTINQTGGANGITGALKIGGVLTAAADFRALEITNTSHFAVYQSGASAKNYFAGNVGIGTATPALTLDILSASPNTTGIFSLANSTVTTPLKTFVTNATPESAITGSVGDVAFSSVGFAYIKETGTATNTGWKKFATSTDLAGLGNGIISALPLADTYISAANHELNISGLSRFTFSDNAGFVVGVIDVTDVPDFLGMTTPGRGIAAYDVVNSNFVVGRYNRGSGLNRAFSFHSNPDAIAVFNGGTGSGTFQGIVYEADYAANFVSRSLVDKAYVDAAITAGEDGNGIISALPGADVDIITDNTLALEDTDGERLTVNALGLNIYSLANETELQFTSMGFDFISSSSATFSMTSQEAFSIATTNDDISLNAGSANITLTAGIASVSGTFNANSNIAVTGTATFRGASGAAGEASFFEPLVSGTNTHTLRAAAMASNMVTYLPTSAPATENGVFERDAAGNTILRATVYGSISGTPDGSGDITVSHSNDDGTFNVDVTLTGTGTNVGRVQVHTKTTTNFKIRFFDVAGAAVTSGTVTADYTLIDI
jgi:hypothetical protein